MTPLVHPGVSAKYTGLVQLLKQKTPTLVDPTVCTYYFTLPTPQAAAIHNVVNLSTHLQHAVETKSH